MTKIVAHRCGAGLRPENTLAACAYAVSLGVDGLEIDVRLSRDGEVVVFHDAAPDPSHIRDANGGRLHGRPPPVRVLELRDLKAFDAGHPRAGATGAEACAVPGERIPALGEFLSFLSGGAGTPLLLIELKTDFHTGLPLDPCELTDKVLFVLRRQATDTPVRLMSFDWRCLVHGMRSLPPDSCVFLTAPRTPAHKKGPWFAGHDPADYGGSAVKAISALGGRHWGPHFSELNAGTVSDAHESGLAVSTWTVNEPARMRHMQTLGIDYLITDYPDRALALREGMPVPSPSQ